MPGPPTFVIGEFAIQPEKQETWSFSALRAFEECPMRWALSRTVIPCFGGRVPHKPSRSSVEGTLLHELLERFERQLGNSNTEVFRPRRTLLALLAVWVKNNENNPRINSQALAGQMRIEEILRAFGEAHSHITIEKRQPTIGAPSGDNRTGVFSGAESWLRDPKSKLCGRADFISRSEIVDFKSGDQREEHAEQIAFYGALYVAMTGRAPTTLRLIYTGNGEIVDVPVPTLNELESLLEAMRQRAVAADQQVASSELPAKPEQAKCAYCHVRGLCDEYWRSLANNDQAEGVVDYRPTMVATSESAALGLYVRDTFAGVSSVIHLPQDVAEKVNANFRRIRILTLRANAGTEGIRFAFTQNSEVYVR